MIDYTIEYDDVLEWVIESWKDKNGDLIRRTTKTNREGHLIQQIKTKNWTFENYVAPPLHEFFK